MGGLLEAVPVSLEGLAGRCATWGTKIAGVSAPGVPRSAGWASAAAVSAIHARVAVGAELLAGRMAATSADLASTAVSFTAQDEQSAALISRVAEGI